MASDAENISAAISAITAELAANPTAVSYSIDGQSVQRHEMVKRLQDLLLLRAQLEGPAEVISYGTL